MSRKAIAIRHVVIYSVVALGALLTMGYAQTPLAWALPVPGFVGNTSMILATGGGGGVVDFAVFAPGSAFTGLGTFTAGIGSGAFDPHPAKDFAYFYEAVNNTTASAEISWRTISQNFGVPAVPLVNPTSWGFFSNTIFTNGKGVVGPSNDLMASDTPGFTHTGPYGFSVIDPTSTAINTHAMLVCTDCINDLFGGRTAVSIFAFTSPVPPTYRPKDVGFIEGNTASGTDPTDAPEPSAVLLSIAGLVGCAGAQWRFRFRRSTCVS